MGCRISPSLFGDVFDTTPATDNRDILGTFADWFKVNGSRVRPIYIEKVQSNPSEQ